MQPPWRPPSQDETPAKSLVYDDLIPQNTIIIYEEEANQNPLGSANIAA